MLTVEELQTPRTPKELNQYFGFVYDMATPEERQKARLKIGLWKNFFSEFNVLNIYSNWKFPDSEVSVEYKIGNQGYDAIIRNSSFTEYVEITFPVIGEKDKEEGHRLNQNEYIIDIGEFPSIDKELLRRFRSTVKGKSIKDYNYPNSSLIFAIDTFPLLTADNIASNTFDSIQPFIDTLREFSYKAKAVYLVLLNTNQPDFNKKVFAVSAA